MYRIIETLYYTHKHTITLYVIYTGIKVKN